MGKYIIRRAIQAIPVIFLIAIVSFLLMQAAPGGPAAAFNQNPKISEAQKEAWLARYRDQVAEMARACAEVERNPATLRRIWFGPCACAPTPAEALAQLGPDIPPERVLLGTPDEIVAQMHAFMELGVDYFQVAPLDFPARAGTELLIREVLPAMQASPVRDGGDRVLV